MSDRLGRLLLVTLEAARVNADLPVLGALRSWLDSWERTPWRAVQGAARDALRRARVHG